MTRIKKRTSDAQEIPFFILVILTSCYFLAAKPPLCSPLLCGKFLFLRGGKLVEGNV
jgi:hypothetical protein